MHTTGLLLVLIAQFGDRDSVLGEILFIQVRDMEAEARQKGQHLAQTILNTSGYSLFGGARYVLHGRYEPTLNERDEEIALFVNELPLKR